MSKCKFIIRASRTNSKALGSTVKLGRSGVRLTNLNLEKGFYKGHIGKRLSQNHPFFSCIDFDLISDKNSREFFLIFYNNLCEINYLN